MTTKPNRILIDCTETMESGLHTGIQRVVRSLLREAIQLGRERRQTVMGMVLGERGLERYRGSVDSQSHDPPPALHENVLYYMPSGYLRSAEWLCERVKSNKVRRWFLPKPGHLGAFKLPVKTIELGCKLAGLRSQQASELVLGKGDMLLLPDACWPRLEIWDHFRAARSNGAFVVTVIHDLIPLTHPHFMAPGVAMPFRQYIRAAVTTSDLIVAVSQTTQNELRARLPTIFPDLRTFPQIEAFRNGADFVNKGDSVRSELIDLFSHPHRPTPYIAVATFEPRKNHDFTLQAIETLWSRGMGVQLVFIGRRGWISENLLTKIETHPEFGKRLFKYHDLSDSELAYCYARARGTISSSFVEGFGLPIVESLWHGRKTFVSDIPVFNEVGGDNAVYFGLDAPQNLAGAIAKWEGELAKGESVGQRRVTPLSWRESTALLLAKAQAGYASANQGADRQAGVPPLVEATANLARAA